MQAYDRRTVLAALGSCSLLAVAPRLAAQPAWQNKPFTLIVPFAAETSLARLADRSWQFADRAFGYGLEYPPHSVLNGLKLRSHGFSEFPDTEDAIAYWLHRLQAEQVLPQ